MANPPGGMAWLIAVLTVAPLARIAWLPVFALTLAAVGALSAGGVRSGTVLIHRPSEVIAVRDSDPSSRGRAADPLR